MLTEAHLQSFDLISVTHIGVESTGGPFYLLPVCPRFRIA